ncbi:MAG: hypothetical protein KatS3mg088_531 [Patescibacteria group bacterium]|nr:MAG: hypothetical protein KatS3mg088_531 [Patescibacteria group bacterium]
MAFTKKYKIEEILVFAFLAAFPFGRLLAFEFSLFGFRVSFVFLDFIAFLGSLLFIYLNRNRLKFLDSNFLTFVFPFLFSFLFSIFIFRDIRILFGTFYLVRIFSYLGFYFFIKDFLKSSKDNKKLLENSLFLILLFSLLFGFFQYFFYPDLTSLKFLGWDDHLYRMTGSFLDPGFTGIIFVFGFIFSWAKFRSNKSKKFLFFSLLFLIGISLTFSRASYLSLVVSFFYFSYLKKEKWLYGVLFVVILLLLLLFIPKPAGEGVNLARLYSVFDRIENYRETYLIFSQSPIFGVGFNNLCLAKNIYFGNDNFQSHSCGGSDSSLLFVVSTLGVVGFMILIHLGLEIWRKIKKDGFGMVLRSFIIALFLHSQFNNSLFYPWILAILVIAFVLEFNSTSKIEP